MTSIQAPPKLSLADFLQLPETEHASEYIDGQIYQKPMFKGFEPGKKPEVKQEQDILPVLSSLTDLQLSVQDVFSWLNL